MRAGQPVKFAVLGSSISTGRGAPTADTSWTALLHKWLEMTFSACAELRPGAQFQVTDPQYVASSHMCSQSSIQYVDLAVFASTPLYSEKCMTSKVPADVDFVVIEYGVSDWYYEQEMGGMQQEPNNQVGGQAAAWQYS